MNFYEKNKEALQEALQEVRDKTVDIPKEELISVLYNSVSKIQKQVDLNSKIQCSKQRCSFCCHDQIFISSLEAKYIKENNIYDIDDRRQEKQRTTDYENLLFADKACIMLDENNYCQIYDDRPLVCRNHNIALGEDVNKCLKQALKKGSTFTNELRIVTNEAINLYAVEASNHEYKNIADYDWY